MRTLPAPSSFLSTKPIRSRPAYLGNRGSFHGVKRMVPSAEQPATRSPRIRGGHGLPASDASNFFFAENREFASLAPPWWNPCPSRILAFLEGIGNVGLGARLARFVQRNTMLCFATPMHIHLTSRSSSFLFAGLLCFSSLLSVGQPSVKRKIIIDQDAAGPAGTDQQSILLLIQSPQTEVLGITVVTGDAWLKSEVAHTLRTLEIIGRTDIPVVPGAEYPLVRRQQETEWWEKRYGSMQWIGAWTPRFY